MKLHVPAAALLLTTTVSSSSAFVPSSQRRTTTPSLTTAASSSSPSSAAASVSPVAFLLQRQHQHSHHHRSVELYGLKDRLGAVVRSVTRRGKDKEESSSSSSSSGVAVLEKPDTVENIVETTTVGPVEEKKAAAVATMDEPAMVVVDQQEEELTETQKLMKQVKDAGLAGIISYAAWEIGFWAVSVPVVVFGYLEVAGHWPDLSNKDDLAKLGAEAFAFVNFARFAVPLRIGLALSTTPWIQNNIVDRFLVEDSKKSAEDEASQRERQ